MISLLACVNTAASLTLANQVSIYLATWLDMSSWLIGQQDSLANVSPSQQHPA